MRVPFIGGCKDGLGLEVRTPLPTRLVVLMPSPRVLWASADTDDAPDAHETPETQDYDLLRNPAGTRMAYVWTGLRYDTHPEDPMSAEETDAMEAVLPSPGYPRIVSGAWLVVEPGPDTVPPEAEWRPNL